MSLSANKILLANANAKTAGAFIQVVSIANVGQGSATAMSANVSTGTAQYIPTGIYMVTPAATNAGNVSIEINNFNNSTNANSWTTYLPTNTSGVVLSDGFNLRINAGNTAQVSSVTLYGLNEGNAVSSTFTS